MLSVLARPVLRRGGESESPRKQIDHMGVRLSVGYSPSGGRYSGNSLNSLPDVILNKQDDT